LADKRSFHGSFLMDFFTVGDTLQVTEAQRQGAI
jgi:hypothetical protein